MRDEQLDELLERAIGNYARQSRPGLELRVLNRIHTRGGKRSRVIPLWTLAVPLAACALIFVKPHHDPVPSPPTPPEATTATPLFPKDQVGQAVSPAERGPGRITHSVLLARKIEPPPRRPVFPTPTPLTDAERAFLAFTIQHPATAAQVAANLQKSEPLEIRPLPTESDR
jgi:hypothetical protein